MLLPSIFQVNDKWECEEKFVDFLALSRWPFHQLLVRYLCGVRPESSAEKYQCNMIPFHCFFFQNQVWSKSSTHDLINIFLQLITSTQFIFASLWKRFCLNFISSSFTQTCQWWCSVFLPCSSSAGAYAITVPNIQIGRASCRERWTGCRSRWSPYH